MTEEKNGKGIREKDGKWDCIEVRERELEKTEIQIEEKKGYRMR